MSEWTPRAASEVGARTGSGRLPAAEVKRRMLQQGYQVIRERGLTVGLDDIRMEDLIAAAGVPRSSVWRIWTAKAEYAAELIATAVDPAGANLLRTSFDTTSLETAHERILQARDQLDTPEQRRAVLEDAVRRTTERNFALISSSPGFRTYAALIATMPASADPAVRATLAQRLREAEDAYIDRLATFYDVAFRLLGLRLKDSRTTYQQVATIAAAAVEGLALRVALADGPPETADGSHLSRVATLINAPVAGPGDHPWTLASRAVLAVFDAFLEPDPEYAPPAADEDADPHGAPPDAVAPSG